MVLMQIVDYPSHEVILKDSFYELVEKVGCEKLMDVRTWKSMSERLVNCSTTVSE
jgi:hypothetical protein